MKISGFTIVRNAEKYYFPIKESIMSILPIVDECIVALGKGDADDHTRELIQSIDSEKIKIINRYWSESDFIKGKIYATETNFAFSQCTGDWCFYLQADEVVHEDNLQEITDNCRKYLRDENIDGFLFNYYHFFGDYFHYLPVHGWYKNEIRIVRNRPGIYSYRDAQSFRKNKDEKLNVVKLSPFVFHYGWVRPPEKMQSKRVEQDYFYTGSNSQINDSDEGHFDYGALGQIPVFSGQHPRVMYNFIDKFSWAEKLNYSTHENLSRPKMKHERWKYKILTWIENTFFKGEELFGFKNWHIIKDNN